jgi:hypothetical protein
MMRQWNWCFPSIVSMAKWQHSCRMGVWKGDSICLQTPNHQEHYLNSFPTDTCSVEPLKIALLLGNCRGLYYLLASCVLGMIRIRAIPVNQSSKSPRRLQQRRNGVDSAMASHLAEKERRLQEAWRVVAGEGRRRRESVRWTRWTTNKPRQITLTFICFVNIWPLINLRTVKHWDLSLSWPL